MRTQKTRKKSEKHLFFVLGEGRNDGSYYEFGGGGGGSGYVSYKTLNISSGSTLTINVGDSGEDTTVNLDGDDILTAKAGTTQ